MTRSYLITGGAGFIGSNYVARLISRNEKVTVFDNLSRSGSRLNLEWLRTIYGDQAFKLINGDVREAAAIKDAAREADIIVHLAAQVAVTTSVTKPREDFDVNAMGTFNTLEAARESKKKPVFIYASTNKVYGEMENIKIVEEDSHHRYADYPNGMDENQPLDFHSPYGCSKGCGDQYVHDYHRIYGIPTVVFRQSCIYGTRQFGMEDQGWVAWFVIAAALGRPITIYGDGKQVRDVLFVDDLLNAYDAAIEQRGISSGKIYNIGGGAQNTLSVWKEFCPMLEKLLGRSLEVKWGDWRPGDQKVYVSDISKIKRELGWEPKVGVEKGLRKLYDWVIANRNIL